MASSSNFPAFEQLATHPLVQQRIAGLLHPGQQAPTQTGQFTGIGEIGGAIVELRGICDQVVEFILGRGIRASCEASLRRLKAERLDLYQIHWPDYKADYRGIAQTLADLRREGKIRAIGVSNFGPEDMAQYAEYGEFVSNQLAYSLLFRSIEAEIQPECVKRQAGILCYSPLCQGLLTGKFATPEDVPAGRARTRHFSPKRPQVRHQEPGLESETFAALAELRAWCAKRREPLARVALAWLLHQPAVTAVIAGARSPEQVADNAAAADLDLDAADLAALAERTATLTRKLGTNADMWQSQSRLH